MIDPLLRAKNASLERIGSEGAKEVAGAGALGGQITCDYRLIVHLGVIQFRDLDPGADIR